MRPSLVGLTAALAASMVTAPATAQTIVRAELGAGLAHTFGAFRESYRTGFSTVGRVEFTRENSELALRLGASWQRSKADSANFPGGGHLDSFGGTADIVFEPRANDYAAVAPYVFAGGAMYHNRSSASSTIDVPATTTVTSTRYGVNGGLGLLLAFGDATHMFAEARYQYMFAGEADATGNRRALSVLHLGLGVRWTL